MNITTITRFHYPIEKKESKEYKWRLAFFRDEVLPRIKGVDINVWCNDWQRDEIEALGVKTFYAETETRKNKMGYFVDFVEWKNVKGLKKYDIQIGLDSDDLIEPEFIDKVKECSGDQSIFMSFQSEKIDIKTGKKYKMPRDYSKQGSAIFAIYQPNKENYLFAYQDSHLKMPKYFDKFIFIPTGYCYVNVHNYNDSTKI
jgi:hypothetical protein